VIDDHPIEECPFASDYFDVTVMINVLDHVRDAEACMREATRIVKPGGYFILGQDLTDPAELAGRPEDVGHPILLGESDLVPHLEAFEPVLHRTLPREEGRNPEAHYGTLVFAGRKRS
jgi:ubiquinone/menaquinone biosynthesis C-methylase UbiE